VFAERDGEIQAIMDRMPKPVRDLQCGRKIVFYRCRIHRRATQLGEPLFRFLPRYVGRAAKDFA